MAKSTRRTTKAVAMPTRASTTVPSPSTRPTNIEISKRAFELFCERGCQAGRDLEDWLQAERELQETMRSLAASPEISAGSPSLETRAEGADASA